MIKNIKHLKQGIYTLIKNYVFQVFESYDVFRNELW